MLIAVSVSHLRVARLVKENTSSEEIANHSKARKDVVKAYKDAERDLKAQQSKCDQLNLAQLTFKNKMAQNEMFQKMKDSGFVANQIKSNKDLIKEYDRSRTALLTDGKENIVVKGLAESIGIAKALPEPTLPPVVKDNT